MYTTISMDEFYQLSRQYKLHILDVREEDEYVYGHIASSINLPLSSLQQTYTELPKDVTYYVICHSGARSAAACSFLGEHGYQVVNVQGGMSAWIGEVI